MKTDKTKKTTRPLRSKVDKDDHPDPVPPSPLPENLTEALTAAALEGTHGIHRALRRWPEEPAPDTSNIVVMFELVSSGSGTTGHSHGLFRSAEGAMAAAEEIRQSYRQMFETMSAEDQESTQETFTSMTWAMEQQYLDQTRKRYPMGPPKPCAHYADGSAFLIEVAPTLP